MDPNYGILISSPGVSVDTAHNSQILLNTNFALLKIDTQNKAGFQTMLLLITNDPPEPAVGNDNFTTLAKFKHGYTYPPAFDALFIVVTPPPIDNFHQAYGLNSTSYKGHGTGLIISAMTPNDFDVIYAAVDATWVYIIINRWLQFGTTNILTGTTLQITTHVYVEDVPTT